MARGVGWRTLGLALGLLLLALPALTQPVPGPGPGPVPDPWVVSGPGIYYNGCVMIPFSVTGRCEGNGSLNVSSLFVGGVSVTPGINVLTGLTGNLAYYASGGTVVSPYVLGAGVLSALSKAPNTAGGLAAYSSSVPAAVSAAILSGFGGL
jgi:hypothetical protein